MLTGMTTKIHQLLIGMGYAEDASVGVLPVFSMEGFDTAEEALHSFGNAVFSGLEAVRDHHNARVSDRLTHGFLKACCKASLAFNAEYLFCAKCGYEIRADEKITSRDQVLDYIKNLIGKTNDESEYDIIEGINNDGWEPGIFAPYSGEYKALDVGNYDWHPDFATFGNGSSEWKVSTVSVTKEESGWKSNNPKSIYHRDDILDLETGEAKDEET